MSDWGQGSKNNNIGWGQGAVNNDISWGKSHELSFSGDTDIVGARPLLLDLYPNAAAAYSLRRLNSDYTGDAITVRRASDNTELNIGFVNNELDTSSLTTFCSGSDGFVTTWYDQSGDVRDIRQSIASKQPKIFDSVTGVVLENGKPAVDFDGVDDELFIPAYGTISQPITFYIVNKFDNPLSNVSEYYFTTDSGSATALGKNSSNNYFAFWGANFGNTEQVVGALALNTWLANTTSSSFWLNSNLINTGNIGTRSINGWYIGSLEGASYFNGKISDFIFYPTNNTDDKVGIETNINNFYNIY